MASARGDWDFPYNDAASGTIHFVCLASARGDWDLPYNDAVSGAIHSAGLRVVVRAGVSRHGRVCYPGIVGRYLPIQFNLCITGISLRNVKLTCAHCQCWSWAGAKQGRASGAAWLRSPWCAAGKKRETRAGKPAPLSAQYSAAHNGNYVGKYESCMFLREGQASRAHTQY